MSSWRVGLGGRLCQEGGGSWGRGLLLLLRGEREERWRERGRGWEREGGDGREEEREGREVE